MSRRRRTPNALPPIAQPGAPVAAPQRPRLDIQIDRDALTFGDLKLVMAAKANPGAVDEADVVAMLDRAVVGGIDRLPLSALPQITDALLRVIKGLNDPKN